MASERMVLISEELADAAWDALTAIGRLDKAEEIGRAVDATQPAAGEPIQVEAVAITRSRKNGGLALEWLIEGGISALEGPDVVLLVADGRVWDDEGSGEVYLAPPAETPVRGAEPLAWMTRPLRGSNAGKLCICDPSEARDPELWATPFPVFATRRAAAVAAGEPVAYAAFA